jgi:acyl-CoA reductase-like NAD-dependent aldehyde dehydrogenase
VWGASHVGGPATIKRVFLELGGKSPFIVFDDADLDANAAMCALQAVANAGQGCSINTRLPGAAPGVRRPAREAR